MRVAIVQTNPVFAEKASNIRDAIGIMENVEADLFVLPELCNTGYNFIDQNEVNQLAEEISGETFRSLARFAKERSTHIVYGFAERDERVYNSSALVGPDGLIGRYRKVHLYYRETLFFAPGNLGFPVFHLPFGKVGVMICFDWMFPESARSLALAGAQLIAHPSNLVMPHCPDAMVTRALENRVFTATANRIGEENRGEIHLRYIGKSEIVSPQGEILTRLGDDKTGISVAEINLEAASNKKINKYNDLLQDRKPGQYSVDL